MGQSMLRSALEGWAVDLSMLWKVLDWLGHGGQKEGAGVREVEGKSPQDGGVGGLAALIPIPTYLEDIAVNIHSIMEDMAILQVWEGNRSRLHSEHWATEFENMTVPGL
ncbi:hypothetical protein ANANG_G00289680 [Anguilla anguilla]|uniref:Uncharacterized protein n=1 Tax=Anguilla anguilla TaxID=7936 RepID=A0A9D3RJ80_ANGAN|nr:hypothetical protein ANANG_G00289680 [Anguilla anguilla]